MMALGMAQEMERTCAECGMPRREWKGNGGRGVRCVDEWFCCQGCVGGLCTCSRFETYGLVR